MHSNTQFFSNCTLFYHCLYQQALTSDQNRTRSDCVLVCWSSGLWEQETTTLRSRWSMRSTTTTPPRRWASTTKVKCVLWSTAAAEASDTRSPQVGMNNRREVTHIFYTMLLIVGSQHFDCCNLFYCYWQMLWLLWRRRWNGIKSQ